MMRRMWRMALLWVMVGGVSAASADGERPIRAPSAAPMLETIPSYLRVDVAPGETKEVDLSLVAAEDATLLVADTDCRCVHGTGTFPRPLKAHVPTIVAMQVAGVLPGVKTITLRTTVGAAAVTVDVVSAGLGEGVTAVDACLEAARQRGGAAWFLLPNLHGASRNCGCSAGSLGGIEHLAAFPRWCQARAAGVRASWLLVGDTDGNSPGLSERLRSCGWTLAGPEAIVSDVPAQAVRDPQHVVVVPTLPTSIAHRALVPVPLQDGMLIAGVVVVDHQVVETRLIPVDGSLPAEPAALSWVSEGIHARIARDGAPSQSCQRCHAQAFTAWSASAHARAFRVLEPGQVSSDN